MRGDTLDPDFLTQQLGVAPTFSARKGEESDDGTGVHPTGMWTYRLPQTAGTELGSVVEELLAVFPGDVTLWEEITSTWTVDVCCSVYMEHDTQHTGLDAEVLAALGRRGLALRVELHAPDVEGS